MPLYYLLLLAIIQGLTEFLPVSSSGHLAVLPSLTGQEDQGQFIDVAVHIGTLGAVVLYFWADVKMAFWGFLRWFKGDFTSPGAQLALLLALATVPVVLFGILLKLTGMDDAIRSVKVIAWSMLLFGVVLYVVDQKSPQHKSKSQWSIKDALIMGMWQAVALIPGSSRSGTTITGARILGYSRTEGAKLAMLMSIPTIIASGTLLGAEVASTADWAAAKNGAIAAIFAFGSGLIALKLMMRFLSSISFTPYVIYRIILGIALLIFAYS
ncbi:undecaprenyl-diphosphatase 1 [Amylibacter marinus]|uniref:Undecaprenyl-diphosphatase n=1 Tax=Amylibacter marinus TaxID=1475483 RepID=A0ABQ5VVX5_9RHOB|nr:undecaprenyl-diphosphate phosphatase [Amylibacter marinus]GLQ35454.1 undecaprenyl-diphosphatase 1 [Amylibacter marinus]